MTTYREKTAKGGEINETSIVDVAFPARGFFDRDEREREGGGNPLINGNVAKKVRNNV